MFTRTMDTSRPRDPLDRESGVRRTVLFLEEGDRLLLFSSIYVFEKNALYYHRV